MHTLTCIKSTHTLHPIHVFHTAAMCRFQSTYIYACMNTPTYTHTYTHTHIHTHIHTYTHTHIHTYTHTRIHTYTHTRIHTYTPASHKFPLYAGVRCDAPLPEHIHICMYEHKYTCTHTHTHIHTCIPYISSIRWRSLRCAASRRSRSCAVSAARRTLWACNCWSNLSLCSRSRTLASSRSRSTA